MNIFALATQFKLCGIQQGLISNVSQAHDWYIHGPPQRFKPQQVLYAYFRQAVYTSIAGRS